VWKVGQRDRDGITGAHLTAGHDDAHPSQVLHLPVVSEVRRGGTRTVFRTQSEIR